jgi:hypothetical protein
VVCAVMATALTACGAPTLTPNVSAGIGTSFNRVRVQCEIAGYYTFHGQCASGSLPRSGKTYRLKAYRGFTVTFSLPKNNAAPGTSIVLADATGKGDITGTYDKHKFPLYPSPCAASSCPGKAFLYLELDLRAKSALHATTNGTAAITSVNGYPGTKCSFAGLEKRTRFGWVPFNVPPVTPRGKKLQFSLDLNGTPPGPAAVAVTCTSNA